MTLSEIRAILEAHKREGRLVSPREWAGMVDALLSDVSTIERLIDKAPHLPLETCSHEELERWTKAIHGVLIVLGVFSE